jgi:dTMP kinase
MLLAVEGIDGAGKTTQLGLVSKWLDSQGIRHRILALNSNPLLSSQFTQLNRIRAIDARDAALMTAAEIAGRVHFHIRPMLESGIVVLCEKYITGSRVRDACRNVDSAVLDAIYGGLPVADLTLYFSVSWELALQRKRASGGPGLWESGLDIGLNLPVCEIERRLSDDSFDHTLVDEHFRQFQGEIAARYDATLPTIAHVRFDGGKKMHDLASEVREVVATQIGLRAVQQRTTNEGTKWK